MLTVVLCVGACGTDQRSPHEPFSRLDHPDSDSRVAALAELPELWRQVAAADRTELEGVHLPVLEKALHEGGPEARFYGAVGLSLVSIRHGDDEILAVRVATALAAGATDEDARVRQQVAEGLSSFQPRPPEAAREPLLLLARDPNPSVAQAALGGIGQIRPRTEEVRAALDELARAASESAVKASALRALGDLEAADDAAIDALLDALGDEDRYVRQSAIRAVGRIGSASPLQLAALERIRAADDDPFLREMAEGTLRGLHGQSGVEPEIWDGLRSENDALRRQAALNLGLRRVDRLEPALPILLQAMRDADPVVRRYALKALSESVYADEANRAVLTTIAAEVVDRLDDGDLEARRAALKALGLMTPEIPAAALAPTLALADDPDPKVLELAFWVLSEIRPVEVELAAEILETIRRRPAVAIYAARALSRLAAAEPEVVPLLLDALSDANRDVKTAAMFGLSRSKSMAAEEPLRRIAHDETEDRLVRANAELELQELLRPMPPGP